MKYPEGELNIEIIEIKKIMDLLSNLFSIRTAFFYEISDAYISKEIAGNMGDFQPYCQIIQKELKHKCIACDRDKLRVASQRNSPLLYRCYNGLYEMILPLFMEEILIGYMHFGQVRSEDPFEKIFEECTLNEHSQSGLLKEKYNQMQVIEKEKLIQISELFVQLSNNILQNRIIEIKRSKPEYYLMKYIKDNYSKNVSIKNAAEYIGKSTSWVTHKFKRQYQCTFHAYLMNFRIIEAKEHLKSLSINETAEACGFKNRYHFSKVFKKIAGLTPHQFKISGE